MTTLEELMTAAMVSSNELREAAIRLLRGELAKPEAYLTLRALSLQVGFGVATIRRWRPPFHVIGGAKRYRLSECEIYFRSEAFSRRVAALRAERNQESQRAKWRAVT